MIKDRFKLIFVSQPGKIIPRSFGLVVGACTVMGTWVQSQVIQNIIYSPRVKVGRENENRTEQKLIEVIALRQKKYPNLC